MAAIIAKTWEPTEEFTAKTTPNSEKRRKISKKRAPTVKRL
jgi:hypothetical protein